VLLVRDAAQHAGPHEVFQPLRQHVAGDAETLLEVVEPGDAEERVSHDQHRPPLADDLEALRDRAAHVLEALSSHTSRWYRVASKNSRVLASRA
jgi:hypothetical protein